MTLNEYQALAMRTATDESNNFTYSIFGLMAEAGEIADKVAKAKRKGVISICDDQIINITSSMKHPEFEAFYEGFKKELGDVLWFIAHASMIMGISLEELGKSNIDKLADRARRGVIIGDGDNR